MKFTELDLRIDPARLGLAHHSDTGVLVRARDPHGAVGNFDIAQLERASLLAWLRSGGPSTNALAENLVLLLLGHEVGL